MNNITAEEEQMIISEKIKDTISFVESFTQESDHEFSPIKDHFIFTLQRAYFKCACECYESFEQRRRQEEISSWSRRKEEINSSVQRRRQKEISSFDQSKRQNEITSCVEHCRVPIVNAQQKVENEKAKFQERVNRALKVCQEKFENAKMKQDISLAFMNLDSCLEQSAGKSIDAFPDFVKEVKATLNSTFD